MAGRPKGSVSSFPYDTQRERLYSAERSIKAFGAVEFNSLVEVNRYVQRFIKRAAWTKRAEIKRVDVISSARVFAYGMRYGMRGELDLPPSAWGKMIIAHELAHVLCPPNQNRSAHSREFAGTYLYLVGKMCGKATKDELIQAFFKHNVDWDSTLAS